MSEYDRFDRSFRRNATGLRRSPGGRNWNRIERQLDRRDRGTRIMGMRPWMIAALLLLVGGLAGIVKLSEEASRYDPMAQRVESIEELEPAGQTPAPAYAPKFPIRLENYPTVREGSPASQIVSRGQRVGKIVVAPKYRIGS